MLGAGDLMLDSTLALISRRLQSTGERFHHHTNNFSTTITVSATEECTLCCEIVNKVPKEDWRLRITCLRKCHLQGDLRAGVSLLFFLIITKSWLHTLLFVHLFHLLFTCWPLADMPYVGTIPVLTSAKATLKSVRQPHNFLEITKIFVIVSGNYLCMKWNKS